MKFASTVLASALYAFGSAAVAIPLDLSSGSTGFSNTPLIGGFSDSYTFTLTSSSTATGSITSAVNGSQDIDFVSILLTGPSGVFAFTQLLADPFETWALQSTSLAAGSYTLTLAGLNSPGGASYGGNFAVTPTIPEPETFALVLSGLGVVGFLARRRPPATRRRA